MVSALIVQETITTNKTLSFLDSSYVRAIFDIQDTKNRIAKTRCINVLATNDMKTHLAKTSLYGSHALPAHPIAKTRCMGFSMQFGQLTSADAPSLEANFVQQSAAVRERALLQRRHTDGTSPSDSLSNVPCSWRTSARRHI